MILCSYCDKPAKLIDSEQLYGVSYNMKMWICRPCNAWVGCHRGTTRPLGRLANRTLRHWKIRAHKAFDKKWKGKQRRSRKKAYTWLAKRMNLNESQCHIGKFDVAQCVQVVEICKGEA